MDFVMSDALYILSLNYWITMDKCDWNSAMKANHTKSAAGLMCAV